MHWRWASMRRQKKKKVHTAHNRWHEENQHKIYRSTGQTGSAYLPPSSTLSRSETLQRRTVTNIKAYRRLCSKDVRHALDQLVQVVACGAPVFQVWHGYQPALIDVVVADSQGQAFSSIEIGNGLSCCSDKTREGVKDNQEPARAEEKSGNRTSPSIVRCCLLSTKAVTNNNNNNTRGN